MKNHVEFEFRASIVGLVAIAVAAYAVQKGVGYIYKLVLEADNQELSKEEEPA